jgi:hypothetical protein
MAIKSNMRGGSGSGRGDDANGTSTHGEEGLTRMSDTPAKYHDRNYR